MKPSTISSTTNTNNPHSSQITASYCFCWSGVKSPDSTGSPLLSVPYFQLSAGSGSIGNPCVIFSNDSPPDASSSRAHSSSVSSTNRSYPPSGSSVLRICPAIPFLARIPLAACHCPTVANVSTTAHDKAGPAPR